MIERQTLDVVSEANRIALEKTRRMRLPMVTASYAFFTASISV